MEFIFLLMSLFGFNEAEAVTAAENETVIEVSENSVDEASLVILPGARNNRRTVKKS